MIQILLLSLAVLAAPKYNCTKCESQPKIDVCYKTCADLGINDPKFNSCVLSCQNSATRESCYTTCFTVCERMSGGPMAGNADRGFNKCDKCEGEITVVEDKMAEDGQRIRVCKGKMK